MRLERAVLVAAGIVALAKLLTAPMHSVIGQALTRLAGGG